MDRKIREVLRDPKFLEGVRERAAAHREEELSRHQAFLASEDCRRMLDIFLGSDILLEFDSVRFRYWPDLIKDELGWGEFSDEKVEAFIGAVGDSRLDTVQKDLPDGRAFGDDSASCYFRNLGVNVELHHEDQETVYVFSNAAAVRQRKGDVGPTWAEVVRTLKRLARVSEPASHDALVQLRNDLNRYLGGDSHCLFTYEVPHRAAVEGAMPSVALDMATRTLRNVS